MNSPLHRVRLGAIVLGIVFLIAVVAYRVAGRNWLDAIYMVVITISTVGYGETSSLSAGQQWITIGVILFGISAAVFTLGGFIQMTMEGELQRTLSLGRTTRVIERLKEHVVICGFGRIGQILAQELNAKKQPFVIIDNDPEAVSEARNFEYLVLLGDATEEAVLISAGIERAKCIVTALPNDAANVFITLTSRNLNRELQIIARGEFQTTEKKLLQAGASRVVLPAAIGALRMAAMITRPSTIELMEIVAGQSVVDVEIDEVVASAESPLVGTTIAAAEARRLHGLLIVAVKPATGNMIFNPSSELSFQAGATIAVMGRSEDIDRFRREYSV
jgi:voltage-gated potassium channel